LAEQAVDFIETEAMWQSPWQTWGLQVHERINAEYLFMLEVATKRP
jgi:hypothetical protein